MNAPLPSNISILLVDDNKDGLVVRRSLLEELGYRVEICPNAEEALKLLAASRFDLIVTDYRMPHMSGIELIESIRKLDPKARVILLSGFVEPLGLNEQNTGADTVIVKSVHEPVNLVRAVKRLLNRPAPKKPPGTQRGGGRVRTGTRGNLAH
ncbi:MAG TPA: response regulator [Bryobacteraceae bacterium]|nr:response regulator [Bryobacteraceae bacterium]